MTNGANESVHPKLRGVSDSGPTEVTPAKGSRGRELSALLQEVGGQSKEMEC